MKIINGTVLCGAENSFKKVNISIQNQKISALDNSNSGECFDAEGLLVIPGFIDTHIHGGVGVEFASDNEDFTKAQKWLAGEGVTSFAATVRAMPPESTVAAIKNILRESKRNSSSSKIKGIHLEGPYVSFKKTGVMSPPQIQCDAETVVSFARAAEGLLKIMTFAPEREKSKEIIKTAVENGVAVSIGHTDATYEEALKGIENGATRATHVFNAMRPLSHRETGVLGAVLTDDRVNCEMICDFVHLDEATIRLLYKAKKPSNLTIISDTGFMSGLGDGEFVVGGKKRTVKNGICTIDGRIAGSCVSMLAGVKNLLKMGIPLEEISIMASLNPAKALSVENEIGSIEVGKYADLIVCDKELNIKAVFINGEKV